MTVIGLRLILQRRVKHNRIEDNLNLLNHMSIYQSYKKNKEF